MASYYLFHKKSNSVFPLGDISFNKFYTEDGWRVFTDMVARGDTVLNEMVIRRDDKKEELTIEDFLKEIEKYKIILDF